MMNLKSDLNNLKMINFLKFWILKKVHTHKKKFVCVWKKKLAAIFKK